MGKFLAGVIVTLLCIAAGAYIYMRHGYINLAADASVPAIERFYVRGMVDAWADRNAPKGNNPVQPTDANMIEGVKLYNANCAVCHGSPQNPVAELGRSQYPTAPQFMKNPPDDMSEPMTFQIIKHGISRSGMPAWDKILTDDQMWKMTAFLKNVEKLPPAVDAEWKNASGLPVPIPGSTAAGAQKQPPPAASPDVKETGDDDHDHEHKH